MRGHFEEGNDHFLYQLQSFYHSSKAKHANSQYPPYLSIHPMAHWVRADISRAYAAHRPTYPKALLDFIRDAIAEPATRRHSSICQSSLAVDVGCGTGQATVPLAQIFGRVIGVDPSETQIAVAAGNSSKPANVSYFRAGAGDFHKVPLPTAVPLPVRATAGAEVNKRNACMTQTSSIFNGGIEGAADFIGAFQAAHWFDMKAFSAACHRTVRKPSAGAGGDDGGVVALVSYATVRCPTNPPLDAGIAAMDRMLHEKGHWPAERRHVDDGYAALSAALCADGWELCERREFTNASTVPLGGLLAYFRTWSALDRLQMAHEAAAATAANGAHQRADGGGSEAVLERFITSVVRGQEKERLKYSSDEELMRDALIPLEFPVFVLCFREKV